MTLLQDIEKARSGELISVPIGHKKLGKYIFMAKNMYHLVGGAGGSGKSSWIDYLYVIMIYDWYIKQGQFEGIKLKIILRSLERSKKLRIAKWVCMYIYREYSILMDVPYLMGWGLKKSKVTDEVFALVREAYDWVEKMSDTVELIGGVDNPTGIYLQARNYAESVGTYYRYIQSDGKEVFTKRRDGKVVKAHPKECPSSTKYQPIYVPDDESLITIHINDHLQAMSTEKGYGDKQKFDKMSEYTRILRDLYGMSMVVVNQMNRAISDTMRRVKTELLPEDSDFSGSSNMYNDCDMAGILFNPYKYGLTTMKDYRLNHCIDDKDINRFRSYHLLKNTYGPDNLIFAYQFIGEVGMFRELPAPSEIDNAMYHRIANPRNKEKLTNHV